jgi:hypothetical protein
MKTYFSIRFDLYNENWTFGIWIFGFQGSKPWWCPEFGKEDQGWYFHWLDSAIFLDK